MNIKTSSVRLCLIDVKVPYASGGTPLNLLSLASYLIENHILSQKNIKIIETNRANVLERILEFKPTIIGFSVVTPAYPYACMLAKQIKKQLPAYIIIGGHHITGIPEILDKPFDVGVMGEGEGTLADIVRVFQKHGKITIYDLVDIPNVVFKDNQNKIKKNPMRSLLAPSQIPSYNWSLLKKEEIISYENVVENSVSRVVVGAPIFSARGCPYQCVFCARTIIWKMGVGFRYIPMSHVMKDIMYLYTHFHINALWIYDDTFAVSKERIKQFIKEFSKHGILGKIVLPQVFVRANLIDEEFIQLLKTLGVLTVFMGVESGSPRILKYLKNNSLRISQVKQAVTLFAKYDIRVVGSFMLFIPGEKPKDFDQTYDVTKWLSRQPNAYAIGMYITVPFPGTKLWEDTVVKNNYDYKKLKWKQFVTYHAKQSIAHLVFFRNGLTNTQIDKYWKRVYSCKTVIEKSISSLPGWKQTESLVEILNQKRIARLEMKNRIERIVHQPFRIFTKILNKHVWKYIVIDIRRLLKKVT